MTQDIERAAARFAIETESVEVTRGVHGVPLDPVRRFAPGRMRYFVDGVEVSEEEYRARVVVAVAEVLASERRPRRRPWWRRWRR